MYPDLGLPVPRRRLREGSEDIEFFNEGESDDEGDAADESFGYLHNKSSHMSTPRKNESFSPKMNRSPNKSPITPRHNKSREHSQYSSDDSRSRSPFNHDTSPRSPYSSDSYTSNLYPSPNINNNSPKAKRSIASKTKEKKNKIPSVPRHRNQNVTDDGMFKQKCIGCVCAFFFVCVLLFYQTSAKKSDIQVASPEGKTKFDLFKDQVRELKDQFPGQTIDLWRTILSATRHILVEESPDYPAVLLLALPKLSRNGEHKFAYCLANKLVHILNSLHNRVVRSDRIVFDIKTGLNKLKDVDNKRLLDDSLLDIFENKQSKGVVINHFESMTGTVPLIFHGYCDGDNAPFKDVLIVEIVHTDTDANSVANDKGYMDRYLGRLWGRTLDMDKVNPILARVANNVVPLNGEERSNLIKYC